MAPTRSNVVRLPRAQGISGDDCRLLVDSVVDYAVFMLDPEGYVATWNPGAEKIKGYQASEIIGQHFAKFYPAEDIAAGKPQYELEVAARVGRYEDEGWRLRKDGSRFWANAIITALRDESGTLRGFGKVTRDMTARRAAEEQLRRSEQRFHYLVDAVLDYAIFMLDPSGHVATWNSGAARLKGYTADEIIGRHFSTFYTAEDRKSARPEAILAAVRRDGRFEDEGWRVRKDGTLFWANVIVSALHDENGTLLGFAKVTRDLSPRRRAEEELRRSEERFRLLIENIADYAIYLLDAEGRVTTWNLGAERMKGYKADEIVGKSFASFFPEADVQAGKPYRELAVARAEGRFEDEGWRVRKDGTRFWANAIVNALYDSSGELIGFATITRDLTLQREAEAIERKLLKEQTAREVAEHSERQLRESEERSRALSQRLEIVLEGVADGITVRDRSGRIVFANSAAARLLGYSSAEELTHTTVEQVSARFDILNELGQPVDPAMLPANRVLRGEPGCSATLQVRDRSTGQQWWWLVRASAVTGSDNAPELAVNIWHEVTSELQRDRHTKYLAEATNALGTSLRYDEMLSGLTRVLVPAFAGSCGVYVLEAGELRCASVARPGESDMPGPEAKGESVDVTSSLGRALWNVLESGQPELHDPGAAGSALLVPIRARSRVLGVIALFAAGLRRHYDASELALLEEVGHRTGAALENARLYATAQHAAKVAEEASRAKDEFLATVSHELRTPLNAIVGWAALLRARVADPELSKPVDVIHRNAVAQVRLVDDILDVSRVITGKFRLEPRPTDLVVIAQEALEVIRPSAAAKRITVELNASSRYCLLVADPDRLQQVIWNLLSNAVKFTDPGGTIELSVTEVRSTVVLTVRDTGRGIDPGFLPFVFDRFKQGDSTITRRVGGLGLGLSLVRHIVELHGGSVTVQSEGAGKGATFTISLPVRAVTTDAVQRSQASRADEPELRAAGALTGVRVLVVDDEQDARDLISVVLVEQGAVVETAESSGRGLAALRRFRPDVVISDIGMPDEDGLTFMRRLRALSASDGGRVPAVALTAFAREEDRVRALAAGFTTYIGKPVEPQALCATVAELVTEHRSA